MSARFRKLAILCASALLAGVVSGCSTMNEKMSAGMGDYIPQWAGGLPADAPPRPGTAKYDEYVAERERLRQMPAADRPGAPPPAQGQTPQNAQAKAGPSVNAAGLDPVH